MTGSGTAMVAHFDALARALAASEVEVEPVGERVDQLEALARLNLETIKNMQRAALAEKRDRELALFG